MASAPISDARFGQFISGRLAPLLARATQVLRTETDAPTHLPRATIGQFLTESALIEEILDAHGAASNTRWHRLRARIATLKNFSEAGCELLHLKRACRNYHLLPVEGDCQAHLEEAVIYVSRVIGCSLKDILAQAELLHLPCPRKPLRPLPDDDMLEGMLPRDRTRRHEQTAAERIVHLATSLLELAAEGSFLHTAAETPLEQAPTFIPETVSEENLSRMTYRFHALQSLYDTYVSDSDTEAIDEELRILRGHISIILHLMRVATIFVHFHERHLVANRDAFFCRSACPFLGEDFHRTLFSFCLGYSSRFLEGAVGVCHRMLKRYAQIGRAEVPVPRYHGFHVRPSSLIAKIVKHYGSDVSMEFNGVVYDASSPFELFRANEEINAEKRHRMARHITALALDEPVGPRESLEVTVRRVFLELAARGDIVLHEHPLTLDDVLNDEAGTVGEAVLGAVTKLLALGRIDMDTELTVTFEGDKRVLRDISILAQNGYGEDALGGNIPLPSEIAYLRRGH